MGRRASRKREMEVAVIDDVLQDVCDHREAPRRSSGYRRSGERRGRNILEPKNPVQADLISAIEVAEIVFALGSAGTGKTYVAVSKAVEFLASGQVERLILVRPAVEAGERLGFLPGDMREKVDPYMRPLYDVLHERLGGQAVNAMMRTGQIEIAPLAFMRGRTLSKAVIVLDEGQNATRMQLKMALTRLGEGSRMIVTGDPDQSDLPDGVSGLRSVVADLAGVPGIETVTFGREDVVRSRIVAAVLDRI